MLAVTYQGPQQMAVAEHAQPVLAAGDVLITILAAGVCGTDVRVYKGEHRAAQPGRIPGHEIVGRIEQAAGPLPGGLSVGDAVFVAPNLGCGACRWCGRGQENLCPATQALGLTLDGAFAQQMVVPARAVARGNLIKLAPDADPVALVLAEPLACVVRGQGKLGVTAGDVVLVAGGGPVGLLHVALAKATGAGAIVCSEPSATRRQAALRAGATHVIDPTTEDLPGLVRCVSDGRGADLVVTAAPVHALQAQALELAATWGKVLYFGGLPKSRPTVELDTNLLHYKELTIAGTTASTVEDCRRAAALIDAGLVDVGWMVSHRFGLAQFDQAIAAAQNPGALKVVVIPERN